MVNSPLIALTALGSNATSTWGSPHATVQAAIPALETDSVILRKHSHIYRTPAFPEGSGADFANAAAVLETTLTAPQLLAHLHGIEAKFGRVRRERWGARVLDLDLLAIGAQIHPDEVEFKRWLNLTLDQQMSKAPPELILPHPRLQDRSFVLIPLAEIIPDWQHPVLGLSVAEMLAARPESEKAAIAPFS